MNDADERIICTKNGNDYNPGNLSDGEKQVLCLLADIALNAEAKSFVIVDEPEQNLHPLLAARVWGIIEERLPDAVFLYATHSLSFAIRESVETVIVLSGRHNENQIQLSTPLELDFEELRPFLGAIPSILASDHCVFVEGHDQSFDSIFYQWLLGGAGTNVVPVGGSDDVIRAAIGTGAWGQLADKVRIVGIIDRDFRASGELEGLGAPLIHVLPLHEAESYLCIPELVCDLANHLGFKERPPKVDEIRQIVADYARENYLAVAARRVFAQLHVRSDISLDRTTLATLKSEDDLADRLLRARTTILGAISSDLDDVSVRSLVKKVCAETSKPVDGTDISGILKIFPGKQLLSKISRHVGLQPNDFARSCAKHLQFQDYQELKSLSERVSSAIIPRHD